jgi:ArsR family transcriptional regulator
MPKLSPPLLPVDVLEAVAPILRTIAHPVRLQILDLIRNGAATPTQLAESIGLPLAQISQHLQGMRQLGVLTVASDGRSRPYRVARPSVLGILDCIREHMKARS